LRLDHLPLFRDAESALDGAGWLGLNGHGSGAAAAAHSAAATVEQGQMNISGLADGHQTLLSLI
jgi:hypothetical protein